ncbi:TIGR00341 family protein [Sulfurovum sp.]|uniref:TIGR00341 family protein n=1 Tax=Sulfurovum sp. TaxID=1969726 RepID=UPI0025F3CC88|nr:TIGR00341 family protein [Sulfurovum sp.]
MIYYIYADDKEAFIEECKALGVWSQLLEEQSRAKNEELSPNNEIVYLPFSKLGELDIANASRLLVTGCLNEIKVLMGIAHQNDLPLGIIPTEEQKELIKTFDLPSKKEEAVIQAFHVSEKKIDLLYCNGEIVLQEVVVGDAPPLDRFDSTLNGKSVFDRIKIFWRTMKRVKELQHAQMKITVAQSNEIKLSAVGIVGIKYPNNTFASKLIASQLSSTDGKLSIVILSPTSIMQYMGYLFQSLVSHLTPEHLPNAVGYIRSNMISIEPKEPMDVLIDSAEKQLTPIELEVQEKALALGVGEKFWEKQGKESGGKDSIKIDHLPSDEENADYLSKNIPLFSHASQEQYASLFTNLREESRLSSTFMTLLILATMIATFGLFINSSSVIIGAMLLAPLMQPIVSLSMGVLRQDTALQINGAKTILIGVTAVLATAALIAVFTPIERLSTEMAGRLSPTILDLFVAIVSGVAAAYAKSNEKIVGSLAGVAIAVALVPPIAVAGIGLGWGNWHMFFMAFLLFVTNLVGIVLAAALTFTVLGFSPLHIAKKGMLTWMAIVVIVAIPLYSSFAKMKEDIEVQSTLSNLAFNVGEHDVKLTHIELLHHPKIDEIRCEVISTGILSKKEKERLKEAILKSIHKQAKVIVTFRYRL